MAVADGLPAAGLLLVSYPLHPPGRPEKQPERTRHFADLPDADDVGRRYRDLVRLAHPDSGGDARLAGQRITELNEARRVLLRVG